jgi:undecaprenyl-diphosphatase
MNRFLAIVGEAREGSRAANRKHNMPLIQLLTLALIQGITEFLPISSSAHLILTPDMLGTDDQGPFVDVMAHGGTLLAVLVYFRRDVQEICMGIWASRTGQLNQGSRMALLIATSLPPIVLVGGLLYTFELLDYLRSPLVIAIATLVFALPLWLADKYGGDRNTLDSLSWKHAFYIGVAQAFALIPGASRSGTTMTAARMLSMGRVESARFSMLMAVPVISAFAMLSVLELINGSAAGASMRDGFIVAALSFLTAWGVIAVLMKLVARIGFLPFVLYRLVLGTGLIVYLVLSAEVS